MGNRNPAIAAIGDRRHEMTFALNSDHLLAEIDRLQRQAPARPLDFSPQTPVGASQLAGDDSHRWGQVGPGQAILLSK